METAGFVCLQKPVIGLICVRNAYTRNHVAGICNRGPIISLLRVQNINVISVCSAWRVSCSFLSAFVTILILLR